MVFNGFYNYRVEVYNGEDYLGTFGYIANIRFLSYWLNIHPKYSSWTSIRIYDRASDALMGVYQRGDAIPDKL